MISDMIFTNEEPMILELPFWKNYELWNIKRLCFQMYLFM